MKWNRGHRSDFVDDRRGAGPAGGGALPLQLVFTLYRWFGFRGLLVGGVLAGGWYLYNGAQSRQLLDSPAEVGHAEEDELVSFVSFVFDDLQSTWTQQFAQHGRTYASARMILFTGRVDSACGSASAAVGPFYCPGDQRVYIDLSFYRQLRAQLGAPGDFAQAYVIAHEVGHHVQHLMGTLDDTRDAGAAGNSVRAELQADCLAGVWARSTQARALLESGDIAEALRAAESIGDDALQQQAGGQVRPESWTHGSSEQRMRWFQRGLTEGSFAACDTFADQTL